MRKHHGKSVPKKRILIIKEQNEEHNEEYGKVTKALGDRNLIIVLTSGKEVQCRIPGRFRKNCRFVAGDIVLVALRSFENKYDIIHKYIENEAKILNKQEEIPDFFLDASDRVYENEEHDFHFEIAEDIVSEKQKQKPKITNSSSEDEVDIDIDIDKI